MEVLTAKDSTDATFGFNKTSVLMTECGKVFGLRVCNATAACSVVYPTHDPRRLVVWFDVHVWFCRLKLETWCGQAPSLRAPSSSKLATVSP